MPAKRSAKRATKSRRSTYGKKSMRRTNKGAYKSAIYAPAHYFKRKTELLPFEEGGSLLLSNNVLGMLGSGFVTTCLTFRLSKLINVSDFTALYDQYKILKANVYFKWTLSSALTDAQLSNPPTLMYIRDYDDNANLTHPQFHERATVKQLRLLPNKIVRVGLRPAVLNKTLKDGTDLTSVSVSPTWNKWLDMGDADTDHYGLKYGINYPTGGLYGSVIVYYELVFACKGQR